MLSRSSVALLVAVFMVVQTVRPTLSYALRRNLRREPVPPHPPKPGESKQLLAPKPDQPHPPRPDQPHPPKPDHTSQLLATLQRIRAELATSLLDRAASEISDYSEPEEQLERLGTQRVMTPHVMNVDDGAVDRDAEDEIIADDPEGSVSEKEPLQQYSIEENVLLSKILSLIMEYQKKHQQRAE